MDRSQLGTGPNQAAHPYRGRQEIPPSRPLGRESRRLAGILLIILPTVAAGGASLLSLIVGATPSYLANPVRQDLFRAGHAHAGILLVLSLLVLRYVEEASLSGRWRRFARLSVPVAAILMPAGFFLSIAAPTATRPNALIGLTYLGGLVLATGLFTLGVGLLGPSPPATRPDAPTAAISRDPRP